MRVFLTGGTGFIGSNLVLRMLEEDDIDQIALLVRDEDKAANLFSQILVSDRRLKLVPGDLCQAATFDLDYDIIIHCAAIRMPESEKSAERAVRVNLLETLEFMHQAQRSCSGSFVYMSTQAVYDFKANTLPVPEDGAIKPANTYAFTKFAAEQAIPYIFAGSSTRWAVLRSTRVYGLGVGTPWDQLVGKFCRESSQSGVLEVWNGDNKFDLIHIKDIGDLILQLLAQGDEKWNQIYNAGGGATYSVDRLAEICREGAVELGLTPPAIIRPQASGPEQHFFLDISKARDRLGWSPKVTLREGIRELICKAAGIG